MKIVRNRDGGITFMFDSSEVADWKNEDERKRYEKREREIYEELKSLDKKYEIEARKVIGNILIEIQTLETKRNFWEIMKKGGAQVKKLGNAIRAFREVETAISKSLDPDETPWYSSKEISLTPEEYDDTKNAITLSSDRFNFLYKIFYGILKRCYGRDAGSEGPLSNREAFKGSGYSYTGSMLLDLREYSSHSEAEGSSFSLVFVTTKSSESKKAASTSEESEIFQSEMLQRDIAALKRTQAYWENQKNRLAQIEINLYARPLEILESLIEDHLRFVSEAEQIPSNDAADSTPEGSSSVTTGTTLETGSSSGTALETGSSSENGRKTRPHSAGKRMLSGLNPTTFPTVPGCGHETAIPLAPKPKVQHEHVPEGLLARSLSRVLHASYEPVGEGDDPEITAKPSAGPHPS